MAIGVLVIGFLIDLFACQRVAPCVAAVVLTTLLSLEPGTRPEMVYL